MSKRKTTNKLICGDCLEIMKDIPDDSVDLVFGSPPYESQRTYGIGFNLKGQDWVDWMMQVFTEASRISKGLVAMVVQGPTRKFKWSATPALLMADLHRAGFNLRRPAIYYRSGIPGSGGPDWLRCDHEYIICITKSGRLVWSDNIACGGNPLFRVGGLMSQRHKDGERHNRGAKNRSVHKRYIQEGEKYNGKETIFKNPKKANPGDVLKLKVGGGHLGHPLAHENEAPFPLKLAEFFVKSFCPPNGITLDPFCGSSTTGHACVINGRNYIGIDCRQSQIRLSRKRLVKIRKEMRK